MVCIRCKMVVKDELTKLGIKHMVVELGEVELLEEMTPSNMMSLKFPS